MKSWYNFTDISHVLYVILCCYIKLYFVVMCRQHNVPCCSSTGVPFTTTLYTSTHCIIPGCHSCPMFPILNHFCLPSHLSHVDSKKLSCPYCLLPYSGLVGFNDLFSSSINIVHE